MAIVSSGVLFLGNSEEIVDGRSIGRELGRENQGEVSLGESSARSLAQREGSQQISMQDFYGKSQAQCFPHTFGFDSKDPRRACTNYIVGSLTIYSTQSIDCESFQQWNETAGSTPFFTDAACTQAWFRILYGWYSFQNGLGELWAINFGPSGWTKCAPCS